MNWKLLLAVVTIAAGTMSPVFCGVDDDEAETPSQDGLTNDELQELLHMLDDAPSKEQPKFESHPLLHLGELLLDEGDAGEQANNDNGYHLHPTTTPKPQRTIAPSFMEQLPSATMQKRADVGPSSPSPETLPANEDLIQQLSLFNSLLMSLSTNESATTPSPSPLSEQQLALLNSLFGSVPQTSTELPESSILKRQTESPISQTPSPSSPDMSALTHLLTQIAKNPPASNPVILQALPTVATATHLKNFHPSSGHMESSASNQLSGILSLLGALGTLTKIQTQAHQLQQQPGLFGLGSTPSTLASPLPTQSNIFANLLQSQPLAQASQQHPNIFGNLFNQQSQAAPSLANLLNPGIGSVISTMSNIFSGSSTSGKPRVRGKGVDTRLGLGYRFGDSGDAQLMWDIGPQLFTDPLQNEQRYPMTNNKRKRQEVAPRTPLEFQTQVQQEKEQQQMAASRRHLQIAHPPFPRKFTQGPLPGLHKLSPDAQEQALKELWQLTDLQRQLKHAVSKSSNNKEHYNHVPPSSLPHLFPSASEEEYQMRRNKHLMKRASTPHQTEHSLVNKGPTMPTQNAKLESQSADESQLMFMKIPSPPPRYPLKKLAPVPPTQQPSFFNTIFNKLIGNSSKPNKEPLILPPPPPQAGHPHGAASQMGRWDMNNNHHRFDNFKNTNGELVMTDTSSSDRFSVRNRNANFNSNEGFYHGT